MTQSSTRVRPRLGDALIAAGLVTVSLVGCTSENATGFKTYNQLLTEESGQPPEGSVAAGSSQTMTPPEGNSGSPDASVAAFSTDADSSADILERPASALRPVNVVDGSSADSILKVTGNAPKAPGDGSSRPGMSAADTKTPVATALPGGIQLLVPSRTFKSEGQPAALRVSYDDIDLLKILNMEPVPSDAVSHFPEWLQQLDGQTIRLRGFMYPTFESTGIEQFVLARDNQICCFGRDPKVYDLVAVALKPGKTTDYIPNRPFDVVGKFRIQMVAEQNQLLGLYWIDDAVVIAK